MEFCTKSSQFRAATTQIAPRADEGVAGGAVGGRSGATITSPVGASESNEVRLRQIEGLNLQIPLTPRRRIGNRLLA